MAGQDIQERMALDEQVARYIRKDGERYLYDINKALLYVCGKPAIQYVLESLIDSDAVGKIVVVGPEMLGRWIKQSAYRKAVRFREQGPERVENALRGKEAIEEEGLAMLLAGDIPLISYLKNSITKMIDEVFLAGAFCHSAAHKQNICAKSVGRAVQTGEQLGSRIQT